MTILYLTLYTLILIFFFCAIIRYERKEGHIDQEALFFMMLFSVIWPVSLALIFIVKFFEWFEKVVNK